MSEFKELSLLFSEFRNARSDQHRRLALHVHRFTLALEDYLALPSKFWTDPSTGLNMQYVRLGVGGVNDFEEKAYFTLGGGNGAIDFSMAVTLESAPEAFPKVHHIFQFKVEALAGGVEFTCSDFEGAFGVGDGEDALHLYESLCGAVVSSLRNVYDVSRVF